MKRHFLILLIVCIVPCRFSLAQVEQRNFIGSSFGGSDFHLRDDHASPLIFSSTAIAPSLQYFHRGDESRQYIELSYSYAHLGTTSDAFHTTSNRARIRYSYIHSVANFDVMKQPLSLFVGGSVTSFLSHADYLYDFIPPTTARSIESWYWSNSLDLSMQCEYSPAGREFFSLLLFMPVVSNVSRPAYSPSGDFNYVENDWNFKPFGKTTVFPKNFSLDALISYQRPLAGGFNLQFSYEFFYSFYAEPREVNMYMNNFRAGLFYCF